MRPRAAIAFALASTAVAMAACVGRDPPVTSGTEDAGLDDGSTNAPDSSAPQDATATDAADAGEAGEAACPPPPEGCLPLACGDAAGCVAFCTTAQSQPVADALCRAWGGCIAGLARVEHLTCVTKRMGELDASAAWTDFVQDAGSGDAPDSGWSAGCRTGGAPLVTWGNGEPNDADHVENGQADCADLLPNGRLEDRSCTTQRVFACERSR